MHTSALLRRCDRACNLLGYLEAFGMPSGDLPSYTTLEVAKHNSRGDAWLIVGGKVLDVTTWLDQHPGGDTVLLDGAGTYKSSSAIPYTPEMRFDCYGCQLCAL